MTSGSRRRSSGGRPRSVATERRTSQTAGGGVLGGGGLLGGVNWAVASVRARISASGYADHMLEPLQVVRYHEGEKYEPHHDLFDLCDFRRSRATSP